MASRISGSTGNTLLDQDIENLYRLVSELQKGTPAQQVTTISESSVPVSVTIDVAESDGSPEFTGVSGVEFNQGTGLTLSSTLTTKNRATVGWNLLTTKGDIASYSTTPLRVAVGTNGKALTADSTQTSGLTYSNFSKLLAVQSSVVGGDTVASTGSETAFASAVYTIPVNSVSVGDVFRIKLWGLYGTDVIAPTLRGKIKLGSTVVLDTGALTTVLGVTNGGWSAEGYITIVSIGAGGTIEAQGYAEFATAATTTLSANVVNTAVISLDTTATQALTVTVQWGTGAAANTITLRSFIFEKMRV